MVNIKYHFAIGFLIRMLLIFYGEFHDKNFHVPFTDVDYKVFTDAARNVWMGASPYDRHTYRYSPLLAYVLVPNIAVHQVFGKVLFAILDLVMAQMLRVLTQHLGFQIAKSNLCALFWLYNPISIVISTRGNADTLSSLVVVATLLCLYMKKPFTAGLAHGLCIHMRLYPLVFSLPLYMSLSNYFETEYSSLSCDSNTTKKENIVKKEKFRDSRDSLQDKPSTQVQKKEKCDLTIYEILEDNVIPNFYQIKLVFGCVLMLSVLTVSFYGLYGYSFLHESMLYHLTRKDIRHNFSVYFYLQYLSAGAVVSIWQRALMFMPQVILLIALSIRYSRPSDLPFCFLTQTIVVVMYNPVVTSQYFVWFLSLLPACVPVLNLTLRQTAIHSMVWVAAQLAWLLPAYWLEFRGEDTFLYIWLQGIAFFCANITLLARLLRAYTPILKKNV